MKVDRADEKSVFEVARELKGTATQMKHGDDREFAKTKKNIARMPGGSCGPPCGSRRGSRTAGTGT